MFDGSRMNRGGDEHDEAVDMVRRGPGRRRGRSGYAKKKVKETASQMAPVQVAKGAVTKARGAGRAVADALRDGREAMHHHEDELRAKREGRLESLEDHVAPGDQVFVDGRPVESGRVIVMRERQR